MISEIPPSGDLRSSLKNAKDERDRRKSIYTYSRKREFFGAMTCMSCVESEESGISEGSKEFLAKVVCTFN